MIKSAKSDKVKHIIRLQQKARFRKKEGLFVVEGARLVAETPASLAEAVYLSEDFMPAGRLADWLNDVQTAGASVERVATGAYERMSGVVHSQGVLALVRMPQNSFSDFFATFSVVPDTERALELQPGHPAVSEKKLPLFVCIEGLQDPGNLGTIIRTAEAAGASAVIASEDTVDFYSPKVVRSTMGSIFRLPHFIADDFEGALEELKAKGICLYGAALSEKALVYEEADFTRSCAILIGNEGAGLSEEALRRCDSTLIIPMQGEVESLNAGMAAGVLLFEAARQRRRGCEKMG